jgi:hypothetical protein
LVFTDDTFRYQQLSQRKFYFFYHAIFSLLSENFKCAERIE